MLAPFLCLVRTFRVGFHSVQLSKGSKWASSDSGSARALPPFPPLSSRYHLHRSFLALPPLPHAAIFSSSSSRCRSCLTLPSSPQLPRAVAFSSHCLTLSPLPHAAIFAFSSHCLTLSPSPHTAASPLSTHATASLSLFLLFFFQKKIFYKIERMPKGGRR